MRTRAIVNPSAAGNRTARRWPDIARQIEAQVGALEVAFTDGPQAATRLTREALRDGVEQIVAVGGDGTVNEVVNGFFDGDTPVNPDAILALMMLGTGGDFRKSLGIGPEVSSFLQRLTQGEIRSIDVGRLSFVDHEGQPATRYFDNIASFGLSAEVDEAVNRATFSKKLGGTFAFKWATLKALVHHDNDRVRIRIDDDFDEELAVSIVAVCNGQFFGGGMWIAPGAEVDDGQFDVVMLRDLTFMDFVKHASALYTGKHLELPKVTVRRGRRLEAKPIDPQARVLLDVDGEVPGRLPATFEVVPGALKVRC
jgi:YegS/Rv2252/BmrU family lipid kinase